MKRLILTVISSFCIAASLNAQDLRFVSGQVTDRKGEPIPDAIIKAEGESTTFKTKEDGTFAIEIPFDVRVITVESASHKAESMKVDGSFMVFTLASRSRNAARSTSSSDTVLNEEIGTVQVEQSRWVSSKSKAVKEETEEKTAKPEQVVVEQDPEQVMVEQDPEQVIVKPDPEQVRLEAERQREQDEQVRMEMAKAETAKAEAARSEAERAVLEAQNRKLELELAKAAAVERARIEAEQKAEAEKAEKAAAEEIKKKYAAVQKRFESVVDVSYKPIFSYPYASAGISYIAGYRFNNHLYLGLGAGVNLTLGASQDSRSVGANVPEVDYLSPGLMTIPVFAYLKVNMVDKRTSPFFALAAGANISEKQTLMLDLCDVQYPAMGMFANPQLGLNFRTSPKTSLYFAAGVSLFTAPVCVEYTGYNAILGSAFGYALDIHVGFTF